MAINELNANYLTFIIMFVQKIVTKLNQKQKLEINKLNNDNNDLIRKLFK